MEKLCRAYHEPMHEESIRDEFTHQTETFARAPAMLSAEALGTIVELVPPDPEARWLEVACGPAAVGRTLAHRVGSVHGVDLTPAMIEKAREERRARVSPTPSSRLATRPRWSSRTPASRAPSPASASTTSRLQVGCWRRWRVVRPGAAALIDRLLSEAPPGTERFRVLGAGDQRRLALCIALFRWRRP